MEFKITEQELLELGFTLFGDNHYTLTLTWEDFSGFQFPTMINYFNDHNIFMMNGSCFFPDSLEDLKMIIKVFGKNVNEYKLRHENS